VFVEIKRIEETLEKVSKVGDYTLYKVVEDDEKESVLESAVEEQG
jgi:DNA-binding PadR family transcriptional regulator